MIDPDKVDNKSESAAGKRDERGRWVKGSSGNPSGLPGGTYKITRQLQQAVASERGQQEINAIIDKLFELAKGGDLAAMKLLLDRNDGPVTQRLEQIVQNFDVVVPGLEDTDD